jgi:hypothetical protein
MFLQIEGLKSLGPTLRNGTCFLGMEKLHRYYDVPKFQNIRLHYTLPTSQITYHFDFSKYILFIYIYV